MNQKLFDTQKVNQALEEKLKKKEESCKILEKELSSYKFKYFHGSRELLILKNEAVKYHAAIKNIIISETQETDSCKNELINR